jgi:hypothetical protein
LFSSKLIFGLVFSGDGAGGKIAAGLVVKTERL